MDNNERYNKTIKRDTLIMYLKNSSEDIELDDILYWLSRYTGIDIKKKK
jgi:hypothetical protein